jgi:hypothetical protein
MPFPCRHDDTVATNTKRECTRLRTTLEKRFIVDLLGLSMSGRTSSTKQSFEQKLIGARYATVAKERNRAASPIPPKPHDLAQWQITLPASMLATQALEELRASVGSDSRHGILW